jgi:carboxylesterase
MPPADQIDAAIKPGAEPIDLQEGNSHGVLLLHGFGDTPQTLRLLAHDLHRHGFDVRAPLLPGHGTNVEQFALSRRAGWIDAARHELSAFSSVHATVSIAGLSMGGALAAILAAEHAELSSLVLIAPYLEMPLSHRAAAAAHWLWGPVAGIQRGASPRSILDPVERSKNLGYGVYSGRLLYELWRLASRAQRALPRVTIPTLIIQSRGDPRVAPRTAERALEKIGAREKKLVWVEGGHIVTVDFDRDKVFAEARSWITTHDRRSM